MKRVLTVVVSIASLVCASCSLGQTTRTDVSASPTATREPLRVVIPPEFKYLGGVDKTADEYGLRKLREVQLSEGDLEVRIHVGSRFGSNFFVLNRAGGAWTARYFPQLLCPVPYGNEKGERILDPPKSGWESAWQRMTAAGLLSLSGLHDAGWNDGETYVVETNVKNTYSLAEYVNPDRMKRDEGKQMTAVGQIVAEEFGLKEFRSDFSCPY